MPTIQLFISDEALRGVIQEQLGSAELGAVAVASDFDAALRTDDTFAVILDSAAADKKILKTLKDIGPNEKRKRIFLLGDLPKDWEAALVTETFPKPLRLGHILARLQFYLQAGSRLSSAPVLFGPYRFEAQNRQLVVQENDRVIRLTEKETALLEQLTQTHNPIPREELLAQIWGYNNQIDTHTLETHIYQLRRKLDPEGKGVNWLVNEQGSYRLNRENIG